MTAFAHAFKTSTRNFKSIALVERLRRLCSEDPMLLALMIGIVALVGMFCLFAIAEMATLFGADAFGNFLRDAGQQVGGAGGVGALGAAAAGGAGAAGAADAQTRGNTDRNAADVGDVTPYSEVLHRDILERDKSIWSKISKMSRELQRGAEYFTGTDIIGTVPGGSRA